MAGQAAGLALARDGHRVTVFERFASARPIGAGLLLQPSGIAALTALGLAEPCLAAGARIERLFGRNTRGRTVMDMTYARYRPDAFGLGIHRGILFEVLHRALKDSGANLVLGFEVAGIEDFEHPVLVSADGRREGPFDLVLDAAGSHDHLRKKAFGGKDPVYPWGALWTICRDTSGQFSGVLRQVYDGAHTMVGVLPVGRAPADAAAHVALFWSLKHADYATARAEGLEAWKARVLKIWPETGSLLEGISDFDALTLATYRDVRPKRWVKGRVLLIGDTAHGMSPQLGQGGNLALIDAVTLMHLMRDQTDLDRVLPAFVRARCSHTGYYQLASRGLTPLFQSDSAVAAWLRDAAFLPLSRMPLAASFMRRTLAGYAKLGVMPWRPLK